MTENIRPSWAELACDPYDILRVTYTALAHEEGPEADFLFLARNSRFNYSSISVEEARQAIVWAMSHDNPDIRRGGVVILFVCAEEECVKAQAILKKMVEEDNDKIAIVYAYLVCSFIGLDVDRITKKDVLRSLDFSDFGQIMKTLLQIRTPGKFTKK
jgi:hypothetical protein